MWFIKKDRDDKRQQGDKGNPCALLVGMQMGAATIEKSSKVPQKI